MKGSSSKGITFLLCGALFAFISWNGGAAGRTVWQSAITQAKAPSPTAKVISETTKPVLKSATVRAVRLTDYQLICESPLHKALQHPLECWLSLHPNVANRIVWDMDHNSPGSNSWDTWDDSYRSDLEKFFDDYVAWYEGGMPSPMASEFSDPIVNLLAANDNDGVALEMTESTAWAVYRDYVAFSLAAETHGWYGWSMVDDADEDLQRILLSYSYLIQQSSNLNGGPSVPGHYYMNQLTPAPPTVVFSFLKAQNLIRPTAAETIGAILGWMKGLYHMLGGLSTVNAFYHWGYRGPAPLSRILEGTHLTDPQYAGGTLADLHHWTPMCFGSTYFLEWVLRPLNLSVRETMLCAHYAPYFPAIDRYLSHGDDPYDDRINDDAGIEGEELLIGPATYAAWFQGSSTAACNNVGRQPPELALKHLTNHLMDLYCEDVAAGTVQNGQVTAEYARWYTYDDLNTMGVWDRLKKKAQREGKCSP